MPRPGRGSPLLSPGLSVGEKPPHRNETTGALSNARLSTILEHPDGSEKLALPRWGTREPAESHDHEVVRADRLAAVLAGALGGLRDVPRDEAVEAVERIARGVAAGVLDL